MTRFPDNFLWGAATAAYQIEGSPLADGAGASIWQRFSHDPRLMAAKGDTGDVACDHYNRMESDVALMKELGLQAYRFSVAWGRVLPDGTGRVNEAGLGFYERLVDTLLENGIEPLCTLYHWDLPAALDDRGGWLNRDIAEWFADYGRVLFERLDGRVKKWVTLNEPWVVTDGGYLHGALAPGHRNMFETPIASHNLMRAHGAAVKAYREVGAHQIGLVVNIEPKYPASDSAEDIAATARADAYMNRQYLDPAMKGSYPEEMAEIFGEAWPEWSAEDLADIKQPVDFIGINYYTRNVVKHDETSWPLKASPVLQKGKTHTETGWEVHSPALKDMLLWFKDLYGDTPLYITENGAAFYDPPVAAPDGVHDPLRVAYLRDHIGAIGQAIEAGVDVRGYMLWSLFDNLEWSLGYSKRFGMVHVDFESQKRTPKDSARFFSEVIASNGANLP
ncbi:GH1 family beta-glucosidase [Sphingomonas sp. LY29]|uniref:GH1 family beta-glucosidase n=1 Tax=Sphingomonas sp. LY29 TaxID=3095341 RepID=UPI002D78E053|nr:GH1 family beta-glucosidase [Sphingomonas sp. LY29]WRP26758.1 GH1 family beta-glucosidase [Sphingomonas sp. LY29]